MKHRNTSLDDTGMYSERTATGFTVRASNTVGVRYSLTVQTGPEAKPASCKMCTGTFPGLKRPGRDAHHLSQSHAQVKWIVTLPPSPLCDCIGMSWGDLHLYLCAVTVLLQYILIAVILTWLRFFPTLTEVFPCFFLSCKANARVNLAKTGHGPHSPKLLCCSMYYLFCVVLCTVCV